MQDQFVALAIPVETICIEPTNNLCPIFLQSLFEITFHETKPVAINEALIFSVNSRDRIFAVLDGCDRRFKHNILNPGWVNSSNRILMINLNINV